LDDTLRTEPRDNEVDVNSLKTMLTTEVFSDLGNQIPFMVIDFPTRPAHQMKVVIGMSQLPSGTFVGPQLRLADQPEIGKQGKGSINR
jgi:hypothetical protein